MTLTESMSIILKTSATLFVTSPLQFSLQPGAEPPCEAAKWRSAGHQKEGALCPQPVGAGVFGQV